MPNEEITMIRTMRQQCEPLCYPPGTSTRVTTQETGGGSKVGKRRVGARTGSCSPGCDSKESLN